MKTSIKVIVLALALGGAGLALACEGAGPMTHIGQVTAVDDGSFTIVDMETRDKITFKASSEILTGLKGAAGLVKVNYQDNEGDLTAVGVTF